MEKDISALINYAPYARNPELMATNAQMVKCAMIRPEHVILSFAFQMRIATSLIAKPPAIAIQTQQHAHIVQVKTRIVEAARKLCATHLRVCACKMTVQTMLLSAHRSLYAMKHPLVNMSSVIKQL